MRPGDHAAGADALLRRRDAAIVVAGEHAVVGAGLERAIPQDARGGEVAAARRLEDLEDRMAVVEDRASRRARRSDRRRRRAVPGRRSASLAGHDVRAPNDDEQAAAALDVALQHAAGGPGGSIASFRMTTERLSSIVGVTRAAGTIST